MRLKVSLAKSTVQVFRGLLEEYVLLVHAGGEDITILENFSYLGSIVQNSGGFHQGDLWWIGKLGPWCYGLGV